MGITIEDCRAWAAQCWCDESTKHTVMDSELAEVFAKTLQERLAWLEAGVSTAAQGFLKAQDTYAHKPIAGIEDVIALREKLEEAVNRERRMLNALKSITEKTRGFRQEPIVVHGGIEHHDPPNQPCPICDLLTEFGCRDAATDVEPERVTG